MPNRTKPFANGELTLRETAKRLGVTLGFAYRLLWDNELIGRKHNGRWLISEDSVRARLHKQKQRNA